MKEAFQGKDSGRSLQAGLKHGGQRQAGAHGRDLGLGLRRWPGASHPSGAQLGCRRGSASNAGKPGPGLGLAV